MAKCCLFKQQKVSGFKSLYPHLAMPYQYSARFYFTLTLLACLLYWHTPVLSQNIEPQQQAEQYLEPIASELKRNALSGEVMNVRRHIFSSSVIEATAIWGADDQLLFPRSDEIVHINDSLIVKDRYRLESLLTTATPTIWDSRDIKAEQLFYCHNNAVSICLLINTSELASVIDISKEQLLSELFPSRKQAFFWWSYALFILAVSLLLVAWHQLKERHKATIASTTGDTFTMGDVTIDTRQKRATRHQLCVDLSERDLILLQYFYQHPNEVLSKNALYDAGWGRDFVASSRALEQHIINLRRKLNPGRQYVNLIETVHGQGYRYPADSL